MLFFSFVGETTRGCRWKDACELLRMRRHRILVARGPIPSHLRFVFWRKQKPHRGGDPAPGHRLSIECRWGVLGFMRFAGKGSRVTFLRGVCCPCFFICSLTQGCRSHGSLGSFPHCHCPSVMSSSLGLLDWSGVALMEVDALADGQTEHEKD